MLNLDDYVWQRAWSHIHDGYVKIIKVREDSRGIAIYDCDLCVPPKDHPTGMCLHRREELGEIQWIPYRNSPSEH